MATKVGDIVGYKFHQITETHHIKIIKCELFLAVSVLYEYDRKWEYDKVFYLYMLQKIKNGNCILLPFCKK